MPRRLVRPGPASHDPAKRTGEELRARPNVVVFMADQMTPLALPFHGHPVTRAPHMAQAAAEGVVFDSAYCNNPLCAPSRAVFMSGRLARASAPTTTPPSSGPRSRPSPTA
jgi:arylsulfatase A-like enzyme